MGRWRRQLLPGPIAAGEAGQHLLQNPKIRGGHSTGRGKKKINKHMKCPPGLGSSIPACQGAEGRDLLPASALRAAPGAAGGPEHPSAPALLISP